MKFVYWCMMSTLLTAQPAQAAFVPRNRPYDVEHYKIYIRLDVKTSKFNNTVSIRLKPKQELTELDLDSEGLDVKSVTLAGKKQGFKVNAEKHLLQLSFDYALKAAEAITFDIDYSGAAGVHHDGFFRVQDPGDPKRLPLYFTHFEAISARKFFPSNDEPYDKATTEIIAEVDERYQFLSNGRLVSDELIDGPKKKQKIRRAHWLQDKPHSTYLVNAVFGQFDVVEDKAANGVPLKIYMAPGKTQESKLAMDVMKSSMKFFENFYKVPYPWNGYAMVGIPTFLWGGMENTTLTSMRESAMILEHPTSVLAKSRITSVVAHELAHQWFGDLTTMKWWDDIWLNEAFASYMETMASSDFFKTDEPRIAAVAATWENYFRQEDGPRSHAIVTGSLPSPDDAFDSTNYTKGEHVLKMLEFYIGTENFRKGLNAYMTKYSLGNATYVDFFAEMEKASGVKLKGFVDSWLLKRGYPVITVASQWDPDKKQISLALRQKPNHRTDGTVYDLRIPVAFHRRTGTSFDVKGSILLNQAETSVVFDLPDEPEWVSWNPGGIALAKFDLPRMKDEVLEMQLLNDPDPVSRLAASFELVKDWIDRKQNSLSPLKPSAKSALNRFLEGDPNPYVRSFFLSKLIESKWPKLPPDFAEAATALVIEPRGVPLNDELGRMMLRSRAMVILGKFDHPGVKERLEGALANTDLSIDMVSAAASGVAFRGDEDAMDRLKAALSKQGKRGWPFKRAILLAFASIPSPQAASELSRIADSDDANNEVVGGIFYRLQDNEVLKNSAEGSAFVRDFVLESTRFNEQMKAHAIQAMEESRDLSVQPALREIAEKSKSERLRTLARQIIDKNFPKQN